MNWEIVQLGLSYGLAVLAFGIVGGLGSSIFVLLVVSAWKTGKK